MLRVTMKICSHWRSAAQYGLLKLHQGLAQWEIFLIAWIAKGREKIIKNLTFCVEELTEACWILTVANLLLDKFICRVSMMRFVSAKATSSRCAI